MNSGIFRAGDAQQLLGAIDKRLARRVEQDSGRFLGRSAMLGFALCFAVIFGGLLYGAAFVYITILALLSFPTAAIVNFMLRVWLCERKRRKKENAVPDLLLQASIFPKGTPTMQIIKYLSRPCFGDLSREFAKALQEIQKGMNVESALRNISKRCRSKVVERAMSLLVQAYKSGADMSSAFKEAADDIIETRLIIRERESAMVVQKYTLLLASALIIPLVLGLIAGMVVKLDFTMLSELGMGAGAYERQALVDAAMLGNQIYIAEYAVIVSFFMAQQQGNTSRAFIYVVMLLPTALLTYFVALGI